MRAALTCALVGLLVAATGVSAGKYKGSDFYRAEVRNATARRALANDGTPMVFYYRAAPQPTNDWVFYLEGGFDCYNTATCEERQIMFPHYMSTKEEYYPAVKNWPNSIIDQDCETNPMRHANMVWFPYVTSDVWMGNATQSQSGSQWQFNGRACLDAVLEELWAGFSTPSGPNGATVRTVLPADQALRIMWTGTSAGGIGALLNTNHVVQKVDGLCPACKLDAMIDSGFFVGDLPDPNRTAADCATSVLKCSFRNTVTLGFLFWNAIGNVDPVCALAAQQKGFSVEHCAYGSVATQYVSRPMFLLQYLFDLVELTIDGYDRKSANAAVIELANFKQKTFAARGSSFLPSCWGHVMTGKEPDSLFATMKAGGVSLGDALSAWWHNGSTAVHQDANCDWLTCRECPVTPPWEWNLTAVVQHF